MAANADATIEDVPDELENVAHPKKLVNETPAVLLHGFYFGAYALFVCIN